VAVEPVSWLTQPGPWDIPSVAQRVARYIEDHGAPPVLVCGHSTGGAIALQLAVSRPDLVAGLLLVDTGAHMHGHGDVGAILRRITDDWGEELRAAVLDRSFRTPPRPADRAEFLRWAAPLPPEQGRELARSLPQAEFRLVDAGHTPVYETPGTVAAAVCDLLRRVQAGNRWYRPVS
jgi:3-oxoadipate enol-lactonase